MGTESPESCEQHKISYQNFISLSSGYAEFITCDGFGAERVTKVPRRRVTINEFLGYDSYVLPQRPELPEQESQPRRKNRWPLTVALTAGVIAAFFVQTQLDNSERAGK